MSKLYKLSFTTEEGRFCTWLSEIGRARRVYNRMLEDPLYADVVQEAVNFPSSAASLAMELNEGMMNKKIKPTMPRRADHGTEQLAHARRMERRLLRRA
jgi:hypothetical protein